MTKQGEIGNPRRCMAAQWGQIATDVAPSQRGLYGTVRRVIAWIADEKPGFFGEAGLLFTTRR